MSDLQKAKENYNEVKMTLDDIMNLEPCDTYTKERVKKLMHGKKSVSAIDVLDAELDSLEDYLWLILRPEFLPEKLLHEIGIYCAELVLHIFEKEYPNDYRPRQAIEIKKKWIDGKITDKELLAASADARDAAWDAPSDAARDAVRAAARSAAWASAKDAASAAASAAAWDAAWAAASASDDARAAAKDTASAAASAAAWDNTAWAAASASDDARAAAWAAWAAARDEVNKKIIEYIRARIKNGAINKVL